MAGGMCDRGHVWWGACVVGAYMAGGYAWQGVGEVCMEEGHVWWWGHAWQGACMVGDTMRYGDAVNEWVVRILLECILVLVFKWFGVGKRQDQGWEAINIF